METSQPVQRIRVLRRVLRRVPRIALETVDGTPVLRGDAPVTLSQREFLLKLLADVSIVPLRGIDAARYLSAARETIDRSFNPDGNGELPEELWGRLAGKLKTCEFAVAGGVSVIACLLPFMESLEDASPVFTSANVVLNSSLEE